MKDSWCDPVHNGERWLYGAAAREYSLSLAGGVDAVVREAVDFGVRHALEMRARSVRKAASTKSNVVGLPIHGKRKRA